MANRIEGRFVVSNPKVCHGKPTFRGTRILVADVLEQVATGMAWQAIVDAWDWRVSTAAIAEAACLANEALLSANTSATAGSVGR